MNDQTLMTPEKMEALLGPGSADTSHTGLMTPEELRAAFGGEKSTGEGETLMTPEEVAKAFGSDTLGYNIDQANRAEKIANRGYPGEAVAGLARGGLQTAGMGSALLGLMGKLVGVNGIEEVGMDGYVALMEKAAEYEPAIKNPWEDIDSFGDGAKYATGIIAEQLPNIVTSVLGGGAGLALGKATAQVVAKKFVGKALKDLTLKGIAKEVAEKQVAELATKWITLGAKTGQATGLGAVNIGMETGSIGGEIYQSTGTVRPDLALGYGIPAGMLETVGESVALSPIMRPLADASKAGGPLLSKQFVKSVGAGMATSIPTEAGTEYSQTWLEQLGRAAADPEFNVWSEEADEERTISATAGAVVGGGMSAGANVIAGTVEQLKASGSPLTASVIKDLLSRKAPEGEKSKSTTSTVPTAEELLRSEEGEDPTIPKEPSAKVEETFNFDALNDEQLENFVTNGLKDAKTPDEIKQYVKSKDAAKAELFRRRDKATTDAYEQIFSKQVRRDALRAMSLDDIETERKNLLASVNTTGDYKVAKPRIDELNNELKSRKATAGNTPVEAPSEEVGTGAETYGREMDPYDIFADFRNKPLDLPEPEKQAPTEPVPTEPVPIEPVTPLTPEEDGVDSTTETGVPPKGKRAPVQDEVDDLSDVEPPEGAFEDNEPAPIAVDTPEVALQKLKAWVDEAESDESTSDDLERYSAAFSSWELADSDPDVRDDLIAFFDEAGVDFPEPALGMAEFSAFVKSIFTPRSTPKKGGTNAKVRNKTEKGRKTKVAKTPEVDEAVVKQQEYIRLLKAVSDAQKTGEGLTEAVSALVAFRQENPRAGREAEQAALVGVENDEDELATDSNEDWVTPEPVEEKPKGEAHDEKQFQDLLKKEKARVKKEALAMGASKEEAEQAMEDLESVKNLESLTPFELSPAWEGPKRVGEHWTSTKVAKALAEKTPHIDRLLEKRKADIFRLAGNDAVLAQEFAEMLRAAVLLRYQYSLAKSEMENTPDKVLSPSVIISSVIRSFGSKVDLRRQMGQQQARRGTEDDIANDVEQGREFEDMSPADLERALDALNDRIENLLPIFPNRSTIIELYDTISTAFYTGAEVDPADIQKLYDLLDRKPLPSEASENPVRSGAKAKSGGNAKASPATRSPGSTPSGNQSGNSPSGKSGVPPVAGQSGQSNPRGPGKDVPVDPPGKAPKRPVGGKGSGSSGNTGGKTDPNALRGSDNGSGDGGTVRPGIVVVEEELLPESRGRANADSFAEATGFTLGDDQVQDINLALANFLDNEVEGFMLANGTGVGKTAVQLGVADLYSKETGEKVLLVSMNEGTLNRFREDAKAMGIDLSRFDLVTYAAVGRGFGASNKYGLVVFDEAHSLKNGDSKRSQAAAALNTKNVLFATATPMDSPTAAAYFLSKLLKGVDEKAIWDRMGIEPQVLKGPNGNPRTDQDGNPIMIFVPKKGSTWQSAIAELLEIRKEAIAAGAMVRRYIPFFGKIGISTNTLTEEQALQQDEIEEYWEEQIASAGDRATLRNRKGGRVTELGRWTETLKAEWAFTRIKEELAKGRRPVLLTETAEDQMVKGLGATVKGLLSQVAEKLKAEGIDFAVVAGDNKSKKTKEAKRFQDGKVRVLLGTTASAATGIDLDDQKGNAPRTLLIASVPYSGDVFDQILGRVSRRNTLTPAIAEILTLSDATGDIRKAEIAAAKVGVLRAIQGGEDADSAMLRDSVDREQEEQEEREAKRAPRRSKIRSLTAPAAEGQTRAVPTPGETMEAGSLIRSMATVPLRREKTDMENSPMWVDPNDPFHIYYDSTELAAVMKAAGMNRQQRQAFVASLIVHEEAHVEEFRMAEEDLTDALGRRATNEEVAALVEIRASEAAARMRANPTGAQLLDEAKETYNPENPEGVSDMMAYIELKRMVAQRMIQGETNEDILNAGDATIYEWFMRLLRKLKKMVTRVPSLREAVKQAERDLEQFMENRYEVAETSEAGGIRYARLNLRKRKGKSGGYLAEGLFAAGGKFNRATRTQLDHLDSAKQAAAKRIDGLVADFQRAVKQDYKGKEVPWMTISAALGSTENHLTEAQNTTYQDYLAQGDKAKADEFYATAQLENVRIAREDREAALEGLAENTRKVIEKMREVIDGLGQKGIDVRAFTGPFAETVLRNRGVWLHRSYQIFSNPKWVGWVNEGQDEQFQQIRADMIDYTRNLAISQKALQFRRESVKEGDLISISDAIAKAQADPTLNDLAASIFQDYLNVGDFGVETLLSGRLPGQQNLSVTKLRGQIPEVVRRFWGEYTDPVSNFVNSYASLSAYVANHEFLSNVKELGLKEKWIHDPKGSGIFPEGWRQFAGDRKSMGPLVGLYGPPELVEAFVEYATPQQHAAWLKALLSATGISMFSKTVLSPATVVRNFLGNIMPTVMNGNFNVVSDPKELAEFIGFDVKTGTRGGLAASLAWNPKRYEDLHNYLISEGVLDDNVTAGLLKAIQRATLENAVHANKGKWTHSLLKGMNASYNGATDFYQTMDNYWKVVNYFGELKKVRSFNMTDEQLVEHGLKLGIDIRGKENKSSALAAGIVRETVFTYSRAPKIIRDLRTFPFVAPFVTFTTEAIRTVIAATRIAVAEMRHSNPAVRKSGYRRAIGLSVMALGPLAIQTAMAALSGAGGDDELALREHLPEWQKNAQIGIWKKADGKVTYLDFSFLDPYQVWKEPLYAFNVAMARDVEKGESIDLVKAAGAFVSQAAKPFTGEQIFSSAVIDVLRNQTREGKPVFNPQDPGRYADMATHLFSTINPGAGATGYRIFMAATGQSEKTSGRTYDLATELIAPWVGTRPATVDLENSLGYKAFRYVQDRREAADIYNRIARARGTVSDAERERRLKTAIEAVRKVDANFRLSYLSSLQLGLSKDKAQAAMRAGGVPKSRLETFDSGNFKTYELSQQMLKKLTPENRAKHEALVAEIR